MRETFIRKGTHKSSSRAPLQLYRPAEIFSNKYLTFLSWTIFFEQRVDYFYTIQYNGSYQKDKKQYGKSVWLLNKIEKLLSDRGEDHG